MRTKIAGDKSKIMGERGDGEPTIPVLRGALDAYVLVDNLYCFILESELLFVIAIVSESNALLICVRSWVSRPSLTIACQRLS